MASANGRLADHPGFWTTWTASTVSGFGNYVTTLSVGVLVVLTLDGTATEVGLVRAAGWVPYLLFGLLAGVLIDRIRRRPLLVLTDLGRGVLLCAVPVLAWVGQLTVGWLVTVMLVFGLLSLLHDAAFQAFVPRLVPGPLLTAAHARLDQSDAVAQASGPALAGGLISLFSAPVAVLVDAATFLVSGALLARVRVAEPRPERVSAREVPREVADGLRWVYRHPTLAPMALGVHAWFLLNALTGAVLTPFALRTLGLSAFGLGLALSLAGIGALGGSLVSVRLGRRYGAGRAMIGSHVLCALAFGLMALATDSGLGWVLFGVGQLAFGVQLGTDNANTMGYRQTVTPDRLQGRMNATIRSINRAMIVVGAPLGGVLGDAFGYRSVLWVAAAGLVVTSVVLMGTRLRIAHLGDAYSDPT